MLISWSRFKQAVEIAIIINKSDNILDKAIMEAYFKKTTAYISNIDSLKITDGLRFPWTF